MQAADIKNTECDMLKKIDLSFLKDLKITNFIMLTIAGLINAFGVTFFIAPVNLYDSGISGTSILLSQLTPLSLSVFLVVLNIPLFLLGLKKQGAAFTIYAVFTVACYSLFSWIIIDVLPVDVSFASPLAKQDLLLCALFGGMISGVGSGLAIRYGGAMDGVEVVAVLFAHKLGLSVGTFVMIFNVILYIVCGFVHNNWILPLYSIVTYIAGSKSVDFVVEGINRSKAAMIITDKPEEVCTVLSEEFGKGITTMNAKGFYSNADKTVVYVVLHWYQIGKVRDVVHKEDPFAFITITEVANVFPSNASE